MSGILKGIMSVLVALGIIAIVGTGVILYYNTIRPQTVETTEEAAIDSSEAVTAPDVDLLSAESSSAETETGAETDSETAPTSSAGLSASDTFSADNGHQHTFTEKILKPSTCTESGSKEYTCYCGESYTEAIPMLEHTPGEWITVRQATVNQTGLQQQYCTVCGRVLHEKTLPMLEDTSRTTAAASAATNTSAASSTSAKKSDNAKEETQETVAVHEHKYKSHISTQPTCTSTGTRTYTCTTCGNTFESNIPATNHPSRRTEVEEGDCGNPGSIKVICNICGTTLSSEELTYDHNWGKWEITQEKTSDEKGIKTRTCKNCGEVETKRY